MLANRNIRLLISSFAIGLLSLFFTNMGGSFDSITLVENKSQAFGKFSVSDIEKEYSKIDKREKANQYGVKGGKMMQEQLRIIANVMSLKTRAISCEELRKKIPSIKNNQYTFYKKNSDEVEVKSCIFSKNSTFLERISNSK